MRCTTSQWPPNWVRLATPSRVSLTALYRIFLPESKCIFDEDRRDRETRLVKKDWIRATCLSVVVLIPLGVDRGSLTSPHASIFVSVPPARTTSSSAAGAFQSNSAGLLQIWMSVAGSSVHEWTSGY